MTGGAGSASVGGDCAARLPLVAGAMFGEFWVGVVVDRVAMQESHETRGEVDVEVVDLFIDEEWSGEGLGRARV